MGGRWREAAGGGKGERMNLRRRGATAACVFAFVVGWCKAPVGMC